MNHKKTSEKSLVFVKQKMCEELKQLESFRCPAACSR